MAKSRMKSWRFAYHTPGNSMRHIIDIEGISIRSARKKFESHHKLAVIDKLTVFDKNKQKFSKA